MRQQLQTGSGKSCICFKQMDNIPEVIIAVLIIRMRTQDWMATYEKSAFAAHFSTHF
jgi:hypothetical protein